MRSDYKARRAAQNLGHMGDLKVADSDTFTRAIAIAHRVDPHTLAAIRVVSNLFSDNFAVRSSFQLEGTT